MVFTVNLGTVRKFKAFCIRKTNEKIISREMTNNKKSKLDE